MFSCEFTAACNKNGMIFKINNSNNNNNNNNNNSFNIQHPYDKSLQKIMKRTLDEYAMCC